MTDILPQGACLFEAFLHFLIPALFFCIVIYLIQMNYKNLFALYLTIIILSTTAYAHGVYEEDQTNQGNSTTPSQVVH